MSDQIKRFLAPPVFPGDAEKTRTAAVYNVILWVVVIALSMSFIALKATTSWQDVSVFDVLILALGTVGLVSIMLLRRGYVLLAAIVMLTGLYVGFSYIVYTFDGIRDSVATGYYLVIILASLTMNRRVVYVFGVLCLLALIGAYVAEVNGRIEGFPGDPPIGDVIVWVAGLLVAAVLINYVIGRIDQAHQKAEKILEEQSVQLEQEVTEREQAQERNLQLQQEIIDAQRDALEELSTPVIPIMDTPQGGIIVLPLVGSIDSQRAKDVMRALLAGIREHRASVVILDITGVPIVDSGVASHLDKTIQAAQLKGAQTIITGISDAVAEAIVDLGIDWSDITTLSDLQTGLIVALDSLGQRIVG